MNQVYGTGASGALLDEYERVINELIEVLAGINETALTIIVDAGTRDTNCISIQTILTHVVSAGYGYATYIRRLKGQAIDFPEEILRSTVIEYEKDLKAVFRFTADTFTGIADTELEEPDNSKKMLVSWGQLYDIEQLMEHAIVHVLRHRRQMERFKTALNIA